MYACMYVFGLFCVRHRPDIPMHKSPNVTEDWLVAEARTSRESTFCLTYSIQVYSTKVLLGLPVAFAFLYHHLRHFRQVEYKGSLLLRRNSGFRSGVGDREVRSRGEGLCFTSRSSRRHWESQASAQRGSIWTKRALPLPLLRSVSMFVCIERSCLSGSHGKGPEEQNFACSHLSFYIIFNSEHTYSMISLSIDHLVQIYIASSRKFPREDRT